MFSQPKDIRPFFYRFNPPFSLFCVQYAGVADALTSIYKEGGLNALFVGSAAR